LYTALATPFTALFSACQKILTGGKRGLKIQ